MLPVGSRYVAYPDLPVGDAVKGRRVRITVDGDAPGVGIGTLLRIRDVCIGSVLQSVEAGADDGIEQAGPYFVVQASGRLATSWGSGGLSDFVENAAAREVDAATGTGGTVGAGVEDLEKGVEKTVKADVRYAGNDGWVGDAVAEGLDNTFRPIGTAVGAVASSVAGGFWKSLSWEAILLGLLVVGALLFFYFS